MNSAQRIQSALKRATVLRETFGGTQGYKIKQCKVTRIDNIWYHCEIDGHEFDLGFEGYKNLPYKFMFRNNKLLEQAGLTYQYGVDRNSVQYASSLQFGCGTDLIPILWVIGEVIPKKSSFEWRAE